MKVNLRSTLVLSLALLLLGMAGSAQAAQKYTKHVHAGGKAHWHKKAAPKPKNYPVGQHPYTLQLQNKYAHVYKPTHRGYVRSEFNQLLAMSGWPKKHWNKMYRVATCESGRQWKPSNGHYVGLMQHEPGNGRMTRKQLENPVLNLIVARWMYEKRGWQPWPVCGKR